MSDFQPTWLTPSAHKKLQDELQYLMTDGREEITDRIAEARSHGDIRENADYDAAKNEQGLMESRIRKLRFMLDHAEVHEAIDSGVVDVGSLVIVRDPSGSENEFFVAPRENRIDGVQLASPTSPLGMALIGAAEGDTVTFDAPGGTIAMEIVSIRPFER
ncbi:transcription elongation factor GreA [bacterium]|nr:transcription elongation factor GreA [bacterium]